MNIVCITTTKNECDIIESFVRHNARFCDHFCFIDESRDTTQEILQKLQLEGFSIDVFAPSSSNYQQDNLVTGCLDAIRQVAFFDWAVFLDADEILPDIPRPQFESLLRNVPERTAASIVWKTFVPLGLDYFAHEDPLVENFRPRSAERSPFSKVLVPASLFADVRIDIGNHRVLFRNRDQVCPTVPLPLHLAHFPVRSVDQIVVKNILACHTLTMKRNRAQGEGIHVYRTLENLRRVRFNPAYEVLRDLALAYADFAAGAPTFVDTAAPSVRAELKPLRFRDLALPQAVAIFDREIEYLSRKILSYRKANAAAIEALSASEASIRAPAST